MNKDSDIARDILLRFLFDPVDVETSPSGDICRPTSSANVAEGYPGVANRSPFAPGFSGPDPFTVTDPEHLIPSDYIDPVFDSGDVTVVQTHFEALLKRRLRQEIEPRPPLFPWENTLQEYPDTINQDPQANTLWLDHLQNLDIPSSLPDDVLAELFQQCQQVVQSTWQSGRRLIEALESLFPEQPQTLEHIAGLVLRPAYRSGHAQTLQKIDYDNASSQQQIALAMMAAQNIFEALSLRVSEATPTIQKEWQTSAGPLMVEARHNPRATPQLEVTVHVPQAGTLLLATEDETIETHRTGAGQLVIHLNQPRSQWPYVLEVVLGDDGATPLRFQVLVEPS